MNQSPQEQWKSAESDAAFSPPQSCERRAGKFQNTIWRRNLLEYAAGVLIFVLCGAATIAAAIKNEWLIALSQAAVVAGVAVVLWSLYRRASNLDRRPEEPCRMHLRRQYEHQYKALKTVPLWYVGPLVPGMMLFLIAVVAGQAEAVGWAAALKGITIPFFSTVAVFGGVILLNRASAQSLRKRIEALDALA